MYKPCFVPRPIWFLASLASLLAAAPVSAAVRYDFVALSSEPASFFGVEETFTGSFTYFAAGFVTEVTAVAPDGLDFCSITGSITGAVPCGRQFLLPTIPGALHIVLLVMDTGTSQPFFTYTFPPGALQAPGFYQGQNGENVGTLRVAIVPEPATWAMMIAGFGLIGRTSRQRNRFAAAAVRHQPGS